MKRLLLSVLLLAGCSRGAKVDLLYVDSINAPQTVKAHKPIPVKIRGEFPDPAWKWERNEIVKGDRSITVSVYGKRDPKKIAVQMLVPFELQLNLDGTTPGPLTIIAQGRNSSASTKVDVLQ